MPSGVHSKANYYESFGVTEAVGSATRNYYFYTDQTLRWESLVYGADACDSTDKFTPAIAYAKSSTPTTFVVIATGTAHETADTITNYTTLASTAPVGGVIPAGSRIKLTLTMAGTAANVTGITCRANFSLAH